MIRARTSEKWGSSAPFLRRLRADFDASPALPARRCRGRRAGRGSAARTGCLVGVRKREALAAAVENAVVRVEVADEVKVRREARLGEHAPRVAAHGEDLARLDAVVPVELEGATANMNITLIALDEPTEDYAAVFTRNRFPGSPVKVGKKRLAAGKPLQAIAVNNKISNVCEH